MTHSNFLRERDIRFHLHSQTNPEALRRDGPIIIERGEGPYVIGEDGKRYLDVMAGLWCASLGFENERIAGVAARAYRSLAYYHSFSGRASPDAIDVAASIAQRVPIENARIYFATSGSEAIETMIKLAWLYFRGRGQPERRKIIARDRAFHGSTIFAASLTGLPHMHREFGLPLGGIVRVSCPDTYRGRIAGESEDQFADRLAAELDEAIVAEGPETIAAFIAEPINAGAGVIVPPDTYFEKVRAVLDKYGILLLADEVVCGFGRTGEWFGCQAMGMKPDMMAMAKGLSSSYFPISAVALTPEIYEAIDAANAHGTNFGHGFTNSAHPVGAAIVREVLAIYDEMNLLERVSRQGKLLRERLSEELSDCSIVGDVRGRGLMAGVEIVEDRNSKAVFAVEKAVPAQIERMGMDYGLMLRPQGNTVTFCPPFIVTDEQVEEMANKVGAILREISSL
ncbi:aminotransferase [Microbaculum marinisediminis]|uniref:Aminotransferase n=1 Tax=Microbaculum marinisediminis TaxID=2931392 RepID=A0AAW5R443_9HYPH|nr:aminotransferase [Microbaculum sp. A6E488]MCT8973384.1 aminotransferase [Microbaculum sp. A6E488]